MRAEGAELSRRRLLALAYPDRIAKNRGGAAGAFLLANGRGAQVDPPPRWRASRFSPWPSLPAAPRRAASCWPRRSRWPRSRRDFADRIDTREEITFDQATATLRARRSRRLGALVLSEQPMPVGGERGRRARPRRRHRAARPRPAALDQGPAAMARPGRVSAPRRGRRLAGSLRRCAGRTMPTGWRRS